MSTRELREQLGWQQPAETKEARWYLIGVLTRENEISKRRYRHGPFFMMPLPDFVSGEIAKTIYAYAVWVPAQERRHLKQYFPTLEAEFFCKPHKELSSSNEYYVPADEVAYWNGRGPMPKSLSSER